MKRTLLHYAEKLKKPLHMITAFAVIICTAFSVPVFAESETFEDTITYVQNGGSYIPGSEAQSGKYPLIINNNNNNTNTYLTYWKQTSNVPELPVYAFLVNSIPYVVVPFYDNSLGGFVYASLQNKDSYYTRIVFDTNNQNVIYDEDRQLIYSSFSPRTSNTNTLPSFNSVEDGLNAIASSGSNTTYDFVTTVEVPSGSVAYIGIPSSGALSLSARTTMPMYTSIGSNTWSNVPQRVKQVSSLPDSTTTFPLAGSAIPNWTKTEPYNWLNQSKSAITSTTSWSGSNGNFLTFYNPVYYMDGSIQASTNTVYLTISGYSSIRIYPLQNDMSITAGSTSTSPTDYDGYWDATITDNGDGTGSVSYNPSEGSNLPPTPTSNQYNTGTSSSIIDYINQINQTLTNFAESFINLLKAPVAHIQQLVEAGSSFVGQLSSLYSWLPAEVYNTITSAIILCISVGVLKVLL